MVLWSLNFCSSWLFLRPSRELLAQRSDYQRFLHSFHECHNINDHEVICNLWFVGYCWYIADHISLILFLALSVCLIPNVPILFAACIISHREIPDRASTLYSELNIWKRQQYAIQNSIRHYHYNLTRSSILAGCTRIDHLFLRTIPIQLFIKYW